MSEKKSKAVEDIRESFYKVAIQQRDSAWKEIIQKDAEIAEHEQNMVWALKMLYDHEKGNPVYEEMCGKYFSKYRDFYKIFF